MSILTTPSICYTDEEEAVSRLLSQTPLSAIQLAIRGLWFTSAVLEAAGHAVDHGIVAFYHRRRAIECAQVTEQEHPPKLSTGRLIFHTAILFSVVGAIVWGLFYLMNFIGREVWGQ